MCWLRQPTNRSFGQATFATRENRLKIFNFIFNLFFFVDEMFPSSCVFYINNIFHQFSATKFLHVNLESLFAPFLFFYLISGIAKQLQLENAKNKTTSTFKINLCGCLLAYTDQLNWFRQLFSSPSPNYLQATGGDRCLGVIVGSVKTYTG